MRYDLSPAEDRYAHAGQMEQGEFLTPTQKIIVRLRAVKEARGLTVPQIELLVNKQVSRSTLYRFFEQDSELKYNFDYNYTILPVQNALLVDDTMETGDEIAREKVAGFEAAIQQREEVIAELREQIEKIKADHEKKCREYEDRLALWLHQIEKKDERMDKKDRILEQKDADIRQKDEEIRQLRAKIDELTDRLLGKAQ